MEKKDYGALRPEPCQRELAHGALARRAAREGFVLLKNDGALPLRTRRIALYGMGARKTVKGGTGSGAVQERHSVSIAEGLENAGFEITTKAYLDDYDAAYAAAYQAWHDKIERHVAGMPIRQALGQVAILGGFRWPSGRRITSQDIAASGTDTAVYVLARQAGEGNDRRPEAGDWYLTQDERANLELVARAYSHTVVIVNVGGQIDLSFMDEIDGINALVFFAQGGMEGGSALADVLAGTHNFCGKLADSWPMRYEDIPFAMAYSRLNGDVENEEYREGIYVGYRYFDTFGVAPRYPFGFGLSYTTFAVQAQKVQVNGPRVTVQARVTNTGPQSGREVAQIYLAPPQGKLPKPVHSLAAFGKTKELLPGESETLALTFDLTEQASYYEKDATWQLDAGTYIVEVGACSRDARPAAVLELAVNVTTQVGRSCCAPAVPVSELTAPEPAQPCTSGLPRFALDPAAFAAAVHDYAEPPVHETAEEKRILDGLSAAELVSLVKGGDLEARDPAIHGPLGATGRTSLELRGHGVGNIAFCDGPAGLNLIEHAVADKTGIERPTAIPEKYNFGAFAQTAKALLGDGSGTHIYRYATAWPVELLLAQTWDVSLLEEVGRAMGKELLDFGVTLLLAPGMNIHRNPLCGRNFEYFSEDPLLTGKLAAAQIRGAQSHPGVGLTAKHFCCNNQEENRAGVSANVSERALREIYLKGFEIAVKESRPLAVMSSYNRLNGVYTANRHDLLTDILRCEWGFGGLVMTDWSSCTPTQADPAQCAPAGNDLIMPGVRWDQEQLMKALDEGRLDRAALRRSAARVLRLVLTSAVYRGSGTN